MVHECAIREAAAPVANAVLPPMRALLQYVGCLRGCECSTVSERECSDGGKAQAHKPLPHSHSLIPPFPSLQPWLPSSPPSLQPSHSSCSHGSYCAVWCVRCGPPSDPPRTCGSGSEHDDERHEEQTAKGCTCSTEALSHMPLCSPIACLCGTGRVGHRDRSVSRKHAARAAGQASPDSRRSFFLLLFVL